MEIVGSAPYLRKVMWIPQLGCDIKAEFLIILNGVVTQPDLQRTPTLEDSFDKQWF
jgi:hypothetical protein